MAEPHRHWIEPAGYQPVPPVRAFGRTGTAEASPDSDPCATYPELDFGPLRVRVPPQASVRMSLEDEIYSGAVFFDFPSGSVRLSLFAVPQSGKLWPERAEEIAVAQSNIGAAVSSVWGVWGRELHIVHNAEYNWVIGLDGSRWMLLGRATWTDEAGWELVEVMRSMIQHSVVDRGDQPLPVRAALPLHRPGFSPEDEDNDRATPYSVVMTLLQPPSEEALPEDGEPATVAMPRPQEAQSSAVSGVERGEPMVTAPRHLVQLRPAGGDVPDAAAEAPVPATRTRGRVTTRRWTVAAAAVTLLAGVVGGLLLNRDIPEVGGAPVALPAQLNAIDDANPRRSRALPATPAPRGQAQNPGQPASPVPAPAVKQPPVRALPGVPAGQATPERTPARSGPGGDPAVRSGAGRPTGVPPVAASVTGWRDEKRRAAKPPKKRASRPDNDKNDNDNTRNNDTLGPVGELAGGALKVVPRLLR